MASPIPAVLYEDNPYSPIHKLRSLEDDEASLWSLQVNVSSPNAVFEQAQDGDEDEQDISPQEDEEDYEEEQDDDEYEELCEGLSGISMRDQDDSAGLPAFLGRHTRFVYNSDDEAQEEVDCENPSELVISPSVLRLKGLPIPKGKHLRFSDEAGDDNNNHNDDAEHCAP